MHRVGNWVVSLLILLLPPIGSADEIVVGTTHRYESDVLGEAREYWVALPSSYRSDGYKRYPVAYLLDADLSGNFELFSSMVRRMSADASPQVPEMIVVGIVSSDRVRDSSPTRSLIDYGGSESDGLGSSGGADAFLTYLRDELAPQIDQAYATMNYRVLVGYSFTGLAVLQALYTMPDTFNSYLVIDPSMWWDDQVMLKRVELLDQTRFDRRRLFVSTSQRVRSVYPSDNYVLKFINEVSEKQIEGLEFGSAIYGSEENHHTMPVVSYYDGLRFLFQEYMIPQGMQFRPAVDLKRHYHLVSDALGITFLPRESLVNFFGYDRLYNSQFVPSDADRAIEFFRLNVEYYPDSSNAWNSLGEGYLVRGDTENAIDAYTKSLMLDPSNDNSRRHLAQLRVSPAN